MGIILPVPESEDLEKTLPTTPAKTSGSADSAESLRIDVGKKTTRSKSRRRLRWLFGSLVGFVAFVGLGALGGMQAGISSRLGAERQQKAVEAVVQFNYGLDDLNHGRCDLAVQRFQYVIQLDPSYPDIVSKYSQALLCAGGTATPTANVSTGLRPTPDLRAAEQIFADAQAQLAAQNWDQLLTFLDSLRVTFSDYNAIAVDDMYYVAYRNRGVNRILQLGDLEGGIFDLNRAAQIGPLDAQATNYRDWAVNYIVGASFWEIDWAKVIDYFQSLAAAAPNLHDLSFFTSQDRLATAIPYYVLDLIRQAREYETDKQWCTARDLMNTAASYAPLDPDAEDLLNYYIEKCDLNGNE